MIMDARHSFQSHQPFGTGKSSSYCTKATSASRSSRALVPAEVATATRITFDNQASKREGLCPYYFEVAYERYRRSCSSGSGTLQAVASAPERSLLSMFDTAFLALLHTCGRCINSNSLLDRSLMCFNPARLVRDRHLHHAVA